MVIRGLNYLIQAAEHPTYEQLKARLIEDLRLMGYGSVKVEPIDLKDISVGLTWSEAKGSNQ
jgi:hypothetical protein